MKTYKFKLYSNHGNRELQKTIDSHAQVWNHFVALCRRYYAIYGKYPGKKALMRHLTNHVCGAVYQALNLRDRTWQCLNCHTWIETVTLRSISIG